MMASDINHPVLTIRSSWYTTDKSNWANNISALIKGPIVQPILEFPFPFSSHFSLIVNGFKWSLLFASE